MKPLVVIPTYNELDNVETIVARVRAATPEVDILIADDNSPDGTGDLADRLAAADPKVNVLHRPGKQGLGAAYVAGFSWGVERGYDVLVEMDADGSHQPEQLPRLLEAMRGGADLAIGSRWVPGGSVVNWPLRRKVMSRVANTYSAVLLRAQVRDITAGFRAYTRELLERIDYSQVDSSGYCFQVDLAWRARAAGADIREVPITFIERERGASKMDAAIAVEWLTKVTGWGLREQARRARGVLGRAVPPRR